MNDETKRVEEQVRNPLTVRWTDRDLNVLVDMAWERRLRVSQLVRGIVLDALRKEAEAAEKIPTTSAIR